MHKCEPCASLNHSNACTQKRMSLSMHLICYDYHLGAICYRGTEAIPCSDLDKEEKIQLLKVQ